MPEIQTLTDRNPTENLRRFSRNMHPMQFVREIYQNSIEAGATKVRAYHDKQFLDMGIKKLCFSDNGPGMSAEQMAIYLTQYNSSSKGSGGVHDNYGIGVKATTLVTNPYGVVFLSWTKEEPHGNMLWFTYDETSSKVFIKPCEVTYPDDDGDEQTEVLEIEVPSIHRSVNVINLAELKEFYPNGWQGIKWWECKQAAKVKESGFVVMLLGKNHQDSCEAVTSHALRAYFSQRYLKTKFHLSVEGLKGGTSSGKGLIPSIKLFKEAVEDLTSSDGSKIKLIYIDRNKIKDYFCEVANTELTKGFSALCYRDELYMQTTGKINARSWGITSDSVISKVIIIVTPPEREPNDDGLEVGIYPNDTRDRLLWIDETKGQESRDFDLDAVKRWFIDNQPKRLVDMLKEAAEAEEFNDVSKSRAKSIMSKMAIFLKPFKKAKGDTVTLADDGSIAFPANPHASGIHPAWQPGKTAQQMAQEEKEKREQSRPNDGSESPRKGKPNKSKTERKIETIWKADEEEFMHEGVEHPFNVAPGKNEIRIYANIDYPLFKQAIAQIKEQYLCSEIDIEKTLKERFGEAAEVYVLSISRTKLDVQKYTTPPHMSASLYASYWMTLEKVQRSLAHQGHLKKK
jgi:hypothetical protein